MTNAQPVYMYIKNLSNIVEIKVEQEKVNSPVENLKLLFKLRKNLQNIDYLQNHRKEKKTVYLQKNSYEVSEIQPHAYFEVCLNE